MGDVGHDGGAVEEDADIVGPFIVVDASAVGCVVCAIVDMLSSVYQSDPRHPVPLFFRPVAVRAVAGISRQTGRELEEAPLAMEDL